MNHKLLLRIVLSFTSVFVLSAYSCTTPSLPPTTSGGGILIVALNEGGRR
jgi:hypothetical protein